MTEERADHSDAVHPGSALTGSRGFALASVALFLFALCLRALHVWQLRSAPFFDLKLGDARSYHEWALEIASGNWFGEAVFYQAPLYPYFLASIYAGFGDEAWVVRFCQILLGAVSCVLLADAGRRIFSPGAGIAAGSMLAIYAPAIFFDGLIQKTSLGLFLLCLALSAIARLMQRPSMAASLALGLSLGALALTRENALAIVALVLVWMLLPLRADPRRLLHTTVLLLGLCAMLLPVAARNHAISGEWHLTTSQLGPNFYIGNNRDATGLYMPLGRGRGDPLAEQRDARRLAESTLGKELLPGEVSSYWRERAFEDIRTDKTRWGKLLATKMALVWNAGEVGDTEFQQEHARWSWPLRVSGSIAHFGLLAPLAALGLWATWPQRRRLWILYGFLAAYSASVAAFYVFARYRYPLVPVLMLFAGGGLLATRQRLAELSRSQIASLAAVLLSVALFCNWPFASAQAPAWVPAYNLGSALLAAGDASAAEASFRQTLALEPDRLLVHTQLGIALDAQEKSERAIEEFEKALALDGEFFDAHLGIARSLTRLGREAEALAHLRTAAALAPSSPRPLNNASWLLATSNRIDERTAKRSLRMAKQANRLSGGNDPYILDTLAAAHAANAEFPEAIATAEAARRLALANSDDAFAEQIAKRLQLYRGGERFVARDARLAPALESR